MLVASTTGGIESRSAHTGAPAWARTALTPIARNSVLLPDMFEPVTSRNEPAGPISTSLATHVSLGNSGCPSCAGLEAVCRRIDLGHRPVGMVVDDCRQRAEGLELAQRQEPAAGVPAVSRLPRFQQIQDMEVVQKHKLQGQVDEIRKERLVTDHRQRRNPVQLAHAQQHASAQARRLALDDVQFGARLGHRVHQLKHPQIPRRFAARSSAARRCREPFPPNAAIVRTFRHSTTKKATPPCSADKTPQHVKTRISRTAADRIRHHHNSHGRAASQGPPSAHSTNRSIAAPRSASKRPSRISVCRNSRCGASSIGGLLPSFDLVGRCGLQEPIAQDPNADRRVGQVQKMEQRSVAEQVEIVGGSPVLRRHGDRRLGQRRPVAMQTSDRLLVDLPQQAVALQLAADVFVVLHRREETAKCNALRPSTTAARVRCSSPGQTWPRQRQRSPPAGSSPSVPDVRTTSRSRRIARRVGGTTSQWECRWSPYLADADLAKIQARRTEHGKARRPVSP